jgi:hypothetical protein
VFHIYEWQDEGMWIVGVAWGYVVVLMALTEPSIVAGIMTLFAYGVLPMSILYYVMTSGRRRERRRREQAERVAAAKAASQAADMTDGEDGADGPRESAPGEGTGRDS